MFAGLGLAVALLATLVALQALPLQAQTTTVTFVSNTTLDISNFPSSLRSAQEFTTGAPTLLVT